MTYIGIDTETTGLDPAKNGIHQIAGTIEQGDSLDSATTLEEFNIQSNPYIYAGVETATWVQKDYKTGKETLMDALKVSGVTIEAVEQYPSPKESFNNLLKVLGKHIDQFDREDKAIVYGYNVKFDLDMLEDWARRENFEYLYSFLQRHYVDVMQLASFARAQGLLPVKSLALSSVCKHFDIPLDAHDAMNDIKATKQVLIALNELIKAELAHIITE